MSSPLFVFKVALAGQKSISRKIAMRGSQTLDDLHEAIFDAFDRFDEHLYSFYFPPPGTKKLVLSKVRDYREYSCTAVCEDEGPFSNADVLDASKAKIASLKLEPRQLFFYLFDFGDEWWHEITVESIDAPAEKGKYPRVVDSRGESPPQYPDCEDDEDHDEDE